jgi:TonB-dependent receptor
VPLAMRCNVIPGTAFLPQEINPLNEETKSAYGMVRFSQDFRGDVRLTGNAGVRYVTTDREASGLLAYPTGATYGEAQCAPPAAATGFCALTPAVRAQVRAWANGATTPIVANAKFDYWLPSLNVKLSLPRGLRLRFGASKTIAPPDMGLTRNFYNLALSTATEAVIGGRPTGNIGIGNTGLKPVSATNLDASIEWYFAPVGSLTLAVFHKTLTDVVTTNTQRLPFANNGATFDVVVNQPVNSDKKANIDGFEIGYQQFYSFLPKPFDGFGINANYSYINSSGVPQNSLSVNDPDVSAGRVANINTALLPLQGLSKHNVNLAAIYEKGRVSARLAYNWRSDFLLTTRDVIVPYAPIVNEATGRLDGSVFVTLTPKMKVGVQGVNLLNEVTRTSQILNNDLLKTGRSWFINDRRYSLVMRATF